MNIGMLNPEEYGLISFFDPTVISVSSEKATALYYPNHNVKNVPLAVLYPDMTDIFTRYKTKKLTDVFYRGRQQPLSRGSVGGTKIKLTCF